MREVPAFIVERPQTPEQRAKEPPKWNRYNLIPNEKSGYGPHLAAAWRIRMQCYEAAGGVMSEYNRLLNCKYVEVVHALLLQRAANY